MKATRASVPHEHEFEASHGLPEALPAGERLLWQGSPSCGSLAVRALHVRKVAVYFAVLLAWRGLDAAAAGAGALQTLAAVAWGLPLAVLSLGMLWLMARLISRTTVYTVTDRRIVMRIGVVLTVTYNLPLARIASAGLRTHRDGSGDIVLQLLPPDRIAYLHLWPHARPWQLRRPQPMLRSVSNPREVAQLLSDALARSAGVARQAVPGAAEPLAEPHGHGVAPVGA